MAQMFPKDLILRCIAYETSRNTWIAKCIDFCLVVEEESFAASRKSLEEAILGYLDTVYDTEDYESIPALLQRKSPLWDRVLFNTFLVHSRLHSWMEKCKIQRVPYSYRQAIPIRLAS